MPRTGLTAEEIKDEAIKFTMAKMREVGFEKVRLTDVARELDLSHAALYSHFKDKSALLDAVSERWLLKIDENLEAICKRDKDPLEKIHSWMLALHRAKLEKVKHDPELFRAFNSATEGVKPFVQSHIETMSRQMTKLVKEAQTLKKIRRDLNPEIIGRIIRESAMAFHHPKLVVQYLGEKREKLLHQVIETVLKGLE